MRRAPGAGPGPGRHGGRRGRHRSAERADDGRRSLHRPEVLRPVSRQRVLHRQQRARRGGPGAGGLHADLLLADPRDVPLRPPADRRRPDHGQPAGPVRLLQPGRLGRHDACRRAVRQAAGGPGQPLHAAHARQQLHPRARHRLPGAARRTAADLAGHRQPRRDDAQDRQQRGQPGLRRRHPAAGHRPAARHGAGRTDRPQRPGHPHRDVLGRHHSAGRARA